MNWDEIDQNISRNGYSVGQVIEHYQKLGLFRRDHPSVGAGKHRMISEDPYLFTRTYDRENYSDRVLVGLDLEKGEKKLVVDNFFEDGTRLYDYYSGREVKVAGGEVNFDSEFEIVLLGQK